MLNYWWVTRPKRRLDSIPEVLGAFADISLNQTWSGQRNSHMAYEEALEQAGLKRIGERRDQSGSGGRTYAAWLESLGLIFKQERTGNIKLTLAGEAIMAGEAPADILREQVLKYQFPSAFSVSRGVQVSGRFRIHPFWFLLKLLDDSRIGHLSQDEIAMIVAVEAEDETDSCYERIVSRIIEYRCDGNACLQDDFIVCYGPSRGQVNPDHPYSHLADLANTMINWLEYTQLARRDDEGLLRILHEKREEVRQIISNHIPFIPYPEDHERYQRRYGLDPKHHKDTRNLDDTKTVTAKIIAAQKIRAAYISYSIKHPIIGITPDLIAEIGNSTGIKDSVVEDVLYRSYPHGSIGAFMSSYFEMAFHGRDEAVDFEVATTDLFRDVFHYNAKHLGQTGSLSAPDILLIDDDGYQSIIDNKAYSSYTVSGDHHNRMVHNYLQQINNYSSADMPIGFFSYVSGGFGHGIDAQIQSISADSGVNGSGITVSHFIELIKNQTSGNKTYSHSDLRSIFALNRQINRSDI